ncbi:cullin-1-like isoform X2 [Oryza glaberrima]|uniref:Cullin N-terminal domain-containing protein n=1 Tax=Oryza barthii TaxID=65489 RepID=A0A0D3EYD6_9ORYZ|nr:cullin-1-like isoform X2 [Oryza glaberrima]
MNEHLRFEDGWKILEQGIVKCSKLLEDCPGGRPTVNEYMNYYDCAYRMAVQKDQYCQEMYNSYKATHESCVCAMVLPHLMHKQGDLFWRELVKMWSNYCAMIRFTTGFLAYLDRCFVTHKKLPSLEDAAATSFFSPVFSYFNNEISDVLLTLIRQERDGCNVDMNLLMGIMRGICRSEVKTKLRSAVIQDTYLYYSRKSYEWIVQYPLQDYLAKVQETVQKETKRLIHYLCISEEEGSGLCLKAVSAPLMQAYENYTKEKHIGGQVLLQTYKTVEDDLLDRCSRLTIDNGLDNNSFSHME